MKETMLERKQHEVIRGLQKEVVRVNEDLEKIENRNRAQEEVITELKHRLEAERVARDTLRKNLLSAISRHLKKHKKYRAWKKLAIGLLVEKINKGCE